MKYTIKSIIYGLIPTVDNFLEDYDSEIKILQMEEGLEYSIIGINQIITLKAENCIWEPSNPVYKVWLELIQSCEYFGLKYQIIIIDENLGHINDSSSKKPELLISYKSNQIYPI
jgi:hypothetical protein